MSNVAFHHPRIPEDLNISVNPDQVVWSYGLNTISYPTYGGEVVQILSVYFGDMTVSGTVGTVKELENIYMWFIRYMQDATQKGPDTRFDQHPVQFDYDERSWHFSIWPKNLPEFKYGRDIVAPTWTLTAAVKEPDATLAEQIKDLAVANAAHTGEIATFGKTTADFGKSGDLVNNPWASPDADPSVKDQSLNQYLGSQISHLGDTYQGFVQDYTSGQLSHLPQFSDTSKVPDLGGKRSKALSSKTPGKNS